MRGLRTEQTINMSHDLRTQRKQIRPFVMGKVSEDENKAWHRQKQRTEDGKERNDDS